MIGSIHGILIDKSPPWIQVDCGGIGYEIEVPMSTYYHLPELQSDIFLHVHMVVREDAQLLFGFLTKEEKSSFKSLIKINGIGAKVALSILSGVSMDQFSNAIEQQDVSLLVKIPGIGRKTAERLIVELKDKQDLKLQQSSQHSKNLTDIMDALEALGYSKSDIQKVIKNFNEDINVNEGIKQALQWLSS